ncbi:MAG: hypothetical protein U0992_19115, partial [Planctomycetaceae bacterium]
MHVIVGDAGLLADIIVASPEHDIMDVELLLQVVSRWAHVGAAIVLLGGSVFQKFILMPPLRGLPEAEQQQLRERVM